MTRPGLEELQRQNAELRDRLAEAERSTARTLARATRLSQVVGVLGAETRFEAITGRASREVAELFSADVGLVLLGPDDALSVGGCCGVRDSDVPSEPFALPGLADRDGPVVAGPAASTPWPGWLERYRLRHVACVRLLVGSEPLGVLLLARRGDVPFERADERELGAIGHRIALALENARLHDRMRLQLERLARMQEITTRFSAELELEPLAALVADVVVDEVPADGCLVSVIDEGRPRRLACREPDVAAGRPGPTTWGRMPLRTRERIVGSIALPHVPAAGSEAAEVLGHVVGVAALALDKALLYERSRVQARHDSLTGLLGHRAFQEAMEEHIVAGAPFALLRLDLDDFKQVNDLHGHGVGDDTLRAVAVVLRDGAPADGLVYRVGGEEFCVLLPEPQGEDPVARASAVADDLRRRVATTELRLPVTVSVGLAAWPAHAADRDDLIERADRALYASKRAGKDRTTVAGVEGPEASAGQDDRADHVALLRHRAPGEVVHSAHVGRLAIAVARRLGLATDRLEDLRTAARLHDVGKLGVPATILDKPGPLDADERRVIETHPTVGAELLRARGMHAAARFVAEHHENVDGSGYPSGLRGDAIALESRIIRVADAYVGMVRDRRSRPALPDERAAAELARHRGTRFDPLVVDALLEVERLVSVPALAIG